MSTIANLLIKVGVDTREAGTKLSGFGGKAAKGLRKGFLPAVAVLSGLALGAKSAASAASDLGESQNAVSVVFGDSAGIIGDFSKNAATQAGLSMRELNALVTPVGAGLINYGFSAKDAAKSSVALAKRAADMASVFNTSVPEALQAVQSGLRGEADPLEKFGVGLNEAAVNAKAVEMGLAKTTAAVTPNAKAQARLALILEQTNKFQGDFVKTSDGVANAARIQAAQNDNLKASLGKGLLPVIQMAQGVLGTLTGFMAAHTTTVKIVVGVVAGLAAAVVAANIVMKLASAATTLWTGVTKLATAATKVWTAGQWLLNAAMSANPLAIVIIAVVALAAAIVIAYKNSATFRAIVTGAFNAVKTAAMATWNWIKANWPLLLMILTGPIGAAVVAIVRNWDKVTAVVSAVKGAIGSIVGAVQNVVGSKPLKAIGGAFATAFGAAATAVQGVISAVGTLIGAIKTAIGWLAKLSGNSARAHAQARALQGLGGAGGGVPATANGGIFSGAQTRLIGEAGPEAVIPLTRPRRAAEIMKEAGLAGGGGPTVNIETMVVQDATDIDRIASRLGRQLLMAG